MPNSRHQLPVASAVLDTKFYLPRWRSRQVPRVRLVERLERGVESKLTLISAPAGFGKTTLLAEWLAAAPAGERRTAWLSLDAADSHPATFWTQLVAALQTVVPGVGTNAAALLHAPQPPAITAVLPVLINELNAVPGEIVLVLDDYHVIEAPEVHEGMAFLLDHLPAGFHIVIASRADPPLPLPRLRVRSELVEVRAADLRFLPSEATTYLNEVMGLDLASRDIELLEARTEGWIAALQLAALSAQGRDDVAGFIGSFAGDHRYVVDYLVEEVLQRQPEQVRSFLLQTSILDRLSGPLCEVVTGEAGAKAMLETVERGNLFVVPLDDRRQWYRYHHLFADVLQSHLREEQPELVPVLHGRASEWYAREGQPDRAIRHAIAANDLPRAAGLVELESERAMRDHRPDRLIEWVKSLPDDLVRSMPVLSTYYAMAIQGFGNLEGSASYLDDAERWVFGGEERPGLVVVDREAFEVLPSRVPLARGYLTMAAGDANATKELASRALELLPEDEHHWRGTGFALLGLSHWARGELDLAQPLHTEAVASLERAGDTLLAMISAYNDAELLKARGRLGEARRTYERALESAKQRGEPAAPGATNLHFGLAELCCEHNDLEGARRELQAGEEFGISVVPAATPYRHCLVRARLALSEGDFDRAYELIDEAERRYLRSPVPNVRPPAAWKIRVRLAQGRLAEARDWARAEGLSVDDVLDYMREYQHITLARVLLARYRSERDAALAQDAGRLIERLLRAAMAGGRTGAVIELCILQSLLQHEQGDTADALRHLEAALELAEPEGYVRTFLDEGLAMRDLLRHAVAKGTGGPYALRLLAAFEPETPAGLSSNGSIAGLPEPLTPREIEILRLVATGLQNQAIADHLVISVATVKRHIANTYGKLGVTHRTEAVARANELQLL